ncbi:MAG TPA: rhomboid family intramembrane serine protease [Actinomycetota bacterium]|jgi:membrane associated rhomboid family serine protease|nr:rhomboid family intramembrane serine protease [Actinomycetota bacterium]
MIPLRDANPTRRLPILTLALIAANAAVFLLWQPTFGTQTEQQWFFFCEAQIPYELTHQENLAGGAAAARQAVDADWGPGAGRIVQQEMQQRCPGKSWLASAFVAMFLHGGWLHIGGNMLFLWVFGNNVEDRLGRIAFPAFYLLGGVAATVLQVAFDPSSTIPSLGASGAIGAVLGAYAVLFPHARVTTLVIFFFITVVELPALFVLGAWFVIQLFSGVGELGTNVNGGVAFWAHVGGFVFGTAIAWLFYRGRRGPQVHRVPPRPDYF